MIKEKWISSFLKDIEYPKGSLLGVNSGITAVNLLKLNDNLTLFCVDPWDQIFYRSNFDLKKSNNIDYILQYKMAKKSLKHFEDRNKIIKGFLNEASYSFMDNSLDFVYFNYSNFTESIEQMKEDILLWIPKIKNKGFLFSYYWPFKNDEDFVNLFSEKIEKEISPIGEHIFYGFDDKIRKMSIKISKREGDWNESGYYESKHTSKKPF